MWRTNDFGGLNFEAPGVQVVRKWAEVTTCQVLRNSDGKKISFFFCHAKQHVGSGIEPMPPALEVQSPNHWTTKMSPPLF